MRSHHQHVVSHPHRTLIAAFAVWKVLIFSIAAGSCIGDAYDTSGALVVLGSQDSAVRRTFLANLVTRFASWDAIYYVSVARRGYRFEQEWAFGTALPIVIRSVIIALTRLGFVTEGLSPGSTDGQGSALLETLVGILIANTFHLLSVMVLFRLSLVIWRNHPQRVLVSLLSAGLHVISPAGLFLTAPFAESSCALFSFTGYLLYARSCLAVKTIARDGYLILAGLSFGVATAFRSNGILNGLPFAWEVLQVLPRLANSLFSTSSPWQEKGFPFTKIGGVRRLLALGMGGIAVAAGSLVPQAVAYQRYCSDASGSTQVPRRPWCQDHLPSIYTFVQRHYWNVGFLRYWNLPNIPLFLLAAPMLAILVWSGIETSVSATATTEPARPKASTGKKTPTAVEPEPEPGRLDTLVRSAAAAQVLLAVLAVTNYHVQIITRISSAFPLWYWWLAGKLLRGEAWGSRIVMFMVMYASIQGALFTSFLPPA